MSAAFADEKRRIVAFLLRGEARLTTGAGGARLVATYGEIAVDPAVVAGMAGDGLVHSKSGLVRISASSREALARLAGHAVAPRDLGAASIMTPNGPQTVAVNLSESPLAQLVRRRGRDGAPFLDEREFRAGERLRADYTHGQLMPRVSANWESSVTSGRRDGALADLTDAALAARQRVEAALKAVGPELSGVLVDVCCFLKGLETVELERNWPVRSAKIVLKTALGVLGRHYEPARAVRRETILHWGADDYRPAMG